jgi:hypothetical protein
MVDRFSAPPRSPSRSRSGAAWAALRSRIRARRTRTCKGGSSKGGACTVATEATGVEQHLRSDDAQQNDQGTLTLIADSNVRDWLNGTSGNQALTVMLEVKAPDGTKQILSQTYQDLASPSSPPQALPNVVSIDLSEDNVKTLAGGVNGLVFAQPDTVIATKLQTLFSVSGAPVIVEAKDKTVKLADHTADNLATVLRFKVKLQFLDPL